VRLSGEARLRARCVLKKGGILLGVGVAYLIFVSLTGLGIPCIFHALTGLHCPGCGITRLFVALGRLDLAAAWDANALVLVLLPFLIGFGAWHLYEYIRQGKVRTSLFEQILIILAFILTVVFGILRNTAAFAFLAP
jgi:hypothetical protein